MNSNKMKKYTVYVQADIYYTAVIKAGSLKEALTAASELNHEDLNNLPGEIIDSTITIDGVVSE
jgi:hypothetical protein